MPVVHVQVRRQRNDLRDVRAAVQRVVGCALEGIVHVVRHREEPAVGRLVEAKVVARPPGIEIAVARKRFSREGAEPLVDVHDVFRCRIDRRTRRQIQRRAKLHDVREVIRVFVILFLENLAVKFLVGAKILNV